MKNRKSAGGGSFCGLFEQTRRKRLTDSIKQTYEERHIIPADAHIADVVEE